MSEPDLPLATPSKPRAASGTLNVRVLRATLQGRVEQEDRVAVEAPLEFLLHHPALGPEPASFGTTMRTPGDDEWLAAGLLYGEGIVNQASDIDAIESSTRRPNVVNVRLHPTVPLDVQTAARRFSAGSSCGVCGTTGLDAAIARAAATRIVATGGIELSVLLRLPNRMRTAQSKFGDTGGIHAAALFDLQGSLLSVAEDVGPAQCLRQARRGESLGEPAAAVRAGRALERARELRTGSKGAARGRLGTGRHRRSLEPCGQPRGGIRSHAGGIFARQSLQRIFESSASHERWTLNFPALRLRSGIGEPLS